MNKEEKLEKKKMSTVKKVILSVLLVLILAIVSFIIYEVATVNNTYYIGEKNLQIPVFVYHDIVEDESQIEYDYMQTTVKQFEKQMTGLMKLGYKPITYEDLVAYKNGEKAIPKWSFLVTFDDGYTGVYKYAFEIAKKYNIPMTSFEISDTVGTNGYYDKETPERLLSDTNKAQEDLENNLEDNNILKVFTYPYGLYTNAERDTLWQAGYVQNLTDNRINLSDKLDLSGLHRSYPLNNSVLKILLKIQYRVIRYK